MSPDRERERLWAVRTLVGGLDAPFLRIDFGRGRSAPNSTIIGVTGRGQQSTTIELAPNRFNTARS